MCRLVLMLWIQWGLLFASSFDLEETKTSDAASAYIQSRSDQPIYEISSNCIRELFNISTSSPNLTLDVEKDLYNLWGRKEIASWSFGDINSTQSMSYFRFKEKPVYCAVKAWQCTRKFQDTDYPVGSVLAFWTNISLQDPMYECLSSELLNWCGTFIRNESFLYNQEVLLTANENGVIPALITAQFLMDQGKGEHSKLIVFKPLLTLSPMLEESLKKIDQDKVLSFIHLEQLGISRYMPKISYTEENKHGVMIVGNFSNDQEITKLYEIAQTRLMFSLDTPERAGNDRYYIKVGGGLSGTGVVIIVIVVALHGCIVS